MANWYASAFETNAYNGGEREKIASNSLNVVQGDRLKDTTAGVALAGAGETIIGVSTTKKTFDSDNFTVAQATVKFKPEPEINNTYTVTINGGTITTADVGKYYDLDVNGNVDGTTESTSTGQLLMVKYISSTKGIFRVVNA